MVKVSIIIPVYNVEDYLEECLNSVINQTLTDIEIICVNDGSTDSSLDILKKYAIKDNRIIILNESNNGAGFSRKKGLDIAKGKYISFCDSDDILDEKCLELTYNNAVVNNSDLVFFKIKSFNSMEKSENLDSRFDLSKYFDNDVDFNNFIFDYHQVKPIVFNSFTAIWATLFKKDFLTANDFYFPKKLSFNDIPLHVQSLINANRISFVDEFLYNYRLINNNSISTKSHKSDKVYDIFKITDFLEEYLISKNLLNEFKLEFIKFKLSHYTFHLNKIEDENLKNDFFLKVKEEFLSIDMDAKILNSFEDKYKIIYLAITDSNIYSEYSIRNKLYKYKVNYKEIKIKNKNLSDEVRNLKVKNKNLSDEVRNLKVENKKLKNEVDKLIKSKLSFKIKKVLK